MSRAKHWCFTLNNPETWPIDFTGYAVSYAVHQREHGSTGTPHLQGYVEFVKRVRLSQVRQIIPGAHWEKRQGPRDNARLYCMKEEGRLEGPWEYGEFSSQSQGKRTDLLQVKTLLDSGASESEVASEHFQVWCKYYRSFREYRRLTVPNRDWKSTVHVIYGPTGTGKSRWVAETYPGHTGNKDLIGGMVTKARRSCASTNSTDGYRLTSCYDSSTDTHYWSKPRGANKFSGKNYPNNNQSKATQMVQKL